MKNFLFLLFSVAAFSAPVVLTTASQEANTLKFDKDNTTSPGLSVEVVRAMEKIDPELKFIGLDNWYPTKRIELELEANRIDVFFGLVRSPARLLKMDFIEPALYNQREQLAVNFEDAIVVNHFDDIRALKENGVIGVPQGSAFVDYLRSQGGLIVDDGTLSVVATLKKLMTGRIRFVYFGGAVLKNYIEDEHLETKVKVLPTVFRNEGVFLVVSKKIDVDKLNKLTNAFNALVKSGTLKKLQIKYRTES